jgi:O-antigen ligase
MVALACTFTRSSWIGLAVSLGVLLIGIRPRLLPAFVLLMVLVYAFIPGDYRTRLHSAFDPHHPTNVERTYMWEAGVRMFLDHPWTGVGLEDLKPIYDRYRLPAARERAGHLHSVFIQIAATMGIVGLVAFVILYASLFRAAGLGLKAMLRAPTLAASVRLGVVAGLAGFLVAGLFEWNFGDEELLYLLYCLVGLAWAARGWDRPALFADSSSEPRHGSRLPVPQDKSHLSEPRHESQPSEPQYESHPSKLLGEARA